MSPLSIRDQSNKFGYTRQVLLHPDRTNSKRSSVWGRSATLEFHRAHRTSFVQSGSLLLRALAFAGRAKARPDSPPCNRPRREMRTCRRACLTTKYFVSFSGAIAAFAGNFTLQDSGEAGAGCPPRAQIRRRF